MAKRTVVLDGDPILKKECRPVTNFDDRLATLLDDMTETMMDEDGLGLAAPQVGVMRRVFVVVEESSLPRPRQADEAAGGGAEGMEPEEEVEPVIIEFVNPEIIEEEGEALGYEGCLSFPGKYGAIPRPTRVKVRAFDRHGDPFEYVGEGLMARCVCHENNHLDGITIDDLAEYYYDPEVPHELDKTLGGDDEAPEGDAED